MYWNMKSENPIKKEGDLLLSCNPVSTFWFLVIRYFEKKSFFIPVSSGYPLMIILLRGWICVASLRKRWPSANEIFILYSNKAQRVSKCNLARGKRALLKKSLSIHLTVISFVLTVSQNYFSPSGTLPDQSYWLHDQYMIRLIQCKVQRLIFCPPRLIFWSQENLIFGSLMGIRYHCFTWL